MQKELKYNGYAAVPSDYECQDGDLAAVLGLIPDKGALHPVAEPVNVFAYPGRVLFVHETSRFKHYIGARSYGEYLDWIDSTNTSSYHSISHPDFTLSQIIQVNAIGNTLVILTSVGMFYFLWEGDDSSYLSLGKHLPELPISFGLQGYYEVADESERVTHVYEHDVFPRVHAGGIFPVPDEYIDDVTDAVIARSNAFIAKHATEKGRFMMPFFVRYAYRLFDGSLVMHSAPIFMQTGGECGPLVSYTCPPSLDHGDRELTYFAFGAVFDLDYCVLSSGLLTDLRRWSDIVKSVDIFISAPIYKYDPNGKVLNYGVGVETNWGVTVCKQMDQTAPTSLFPLRYQKRSLRFMSEMKNNSYATSGAWERFEVPTCGDEAYNNKIKNCASYYLLKQIALSELSTAITKVEVPEDYLQSIVTREAMDDDFDSHTVLLPRFSYPYNSRLNLCDLSKMLFDGYCSGAMFGRTDGYVFISGTPRGPDLSQDTCDTVYVYVYLNKEGKTIVVKSALAGVHATNAPLSFFYYPDTDAYSAVVEFTAEGGTVSRYQVDLQKSDFLNGSIFYADGQSVKDVGSIVAGAPTVSSDLSIEIRNKIYTSEVNNPFVFPVLSINTVGNGRIMAIATAAKALSQGQFGQFPMYAFSTDGVWALEVSATTGAFSGRQPITRDVCLSADSIGQIDSAVLFASDRGIMLLSGSIAQCITEGIDNNGDPFNFSSMPHANDIKALLGITAGANDALTEKPFRTFITGCQMLYAYNRQQIIVFNPSFSYAYVYSLESKQWGLIKSTISARVNSYPQAYAMQKVSGNDTLVDYSLENGISGKQFLLTRPLKLDSGAKDVLKTIDTIIQRGEFTKGHVQVILYGSRDLISWFTIYSSQDHYLRGFRGTPYKYFRIALVCSLTHNESIWGATVQFMPRLTDQPR